MSVRWHLTLSLVVLTRSHAYITVRVSFCRMSSAVNHGDGHAVGSASEEV